MIIDRTLKSELKKAVGDVDSREERFAFKHKVDAVKTILSSRNFLLDTSDGMITECIKEYGRPAVAVCFAASILRRSDRISDWNAPWAREVLKIWNAKPSWVDDACIWDEMSPTRICIWAKSYIDAWKEPA